MSRNSWKDYSKKGLGFGKKGFDKAWGALDKLGAPVNRLSNKVGAEAFWPTTLDKECDKAARILRSFCKDGFYDKVDAEKAEEHQQADTAPADAPRGKQRVLVKIPASIIRNAKGLAIFTTMRTGLWFSGAGGSGVLLGRVPETGEWSPPSGILLHTAGLGFLAGIDIYDCVVVINTYEALEGFKKLRCTLGGEISASAGPVGMGGVLESEVHKRQAPIWTYMKSRGFYAGAQVDGTIIIERTDENERFYGEKIPVDEILRGKARHPPPSIRTLMQTIKAAQGDLDVDESLMPPPGEAPSDAIIEEPGQNPSGNDHPFGIPAADDDDPYGVRALESEGLFIREAGTKARPNKEVFEFRPSPSSPLYNNIGRPSLDFRRSWRESSQSFRSFSSTDQGTQTDPVVILTTPPAAVPDPNQVPEPIGKVAPHAGSESVVSESEGESLQSSRKESNDSSLPSPLDTPVLSDEQATHVVDDIDENGDIEIHEVNNIALAKPEIAEVAVRSPSPVEAGSKSTATQMTKPRLVMIPKRPPPPALPPRNPGRKHDSFSTQSSGAPASPSPTSSTHPDIHDYTDYIYTYENSGLFEGHEESKLDAAFSEIQRIRSNVTSGEETPYAEPEEFHSIPPTPVSEKDPAVVETHPTDRPAIET